MRKPKEQFDLFSNVKIEKDGVKFWLVNSSNIKRIEKGEQPIKINGNFYLIEKGG